MKKLSKLVALLLAGAMAMLMLTACGGNIPGENKEAEAEYIAKANKTRSALGMQELDNDPAMKKEAKTWLDNVVDINTGKYDFFNSVKIDTDKNGVMTIKAVAKCTYVGTRLSDLLDHLNFKNNNVNVNAAGRWTKVGVVVQTINDQTYVSVAVQIDPNA